MSTRGLLSKQADEAVVRGLGYYGRITVEDHAVIRDALERAVAKTPDNADAWALLSMAYAEEYKHGFNPKPDPLGRALEAARRASLRDAGASTGRAAWDRPADVVLCLLPPGADR